MTNYSDLNTLLLFDLLVDYITLQLNGIDKSDQLKELKVEADKREVGLYDNAFNKALKNHKPLLEIENENYETPEYIEIISKSLDGSEYAVALVSGTSLVVMELLMVNIFYLKKIRFQRIMILFW